MQMRCGDVMAVAHRRRLSLGYVGPVDVRLSLTITFASTTCHVMVDSRLRRMPTGDVARV